MRDKDRPAAQAVGTELLFENDLVRVWEMRLEPGEAIHWHEHVNDYVFTYLTEHNEIETTLELNSVPERATFAQGYTQAQVVGESGLPVHRIRNVGRREHRQLIVEILGESRSRAAHRPENNGRMQKLDDDETAARR